MNVFYVFSECLIVACCLWASIASARLWWSLKQHTQPFARSYAYTHFALGIWWAFGAAARLGWAVTVGWDSHTPWPYIWLFLWFTGAVLYGRKTDADLQLSKWEHWQDAVRASQILGRRSLEILAILGLGAVTATATFVWLG